MKLFRRFFEAWLALCFLLSFFIVPIYLVAIYPEVPEAYYRFSRMFDYGVVQATPSEFGFWYRLLACGAVVLLGVLLFWRWLTDLTSEETDQTPNDLRSTLLRRSKRQTK